MCSLLPSLVFTILFLNFAWVVDAGLYVINPLKGSECRGNQPCTVTWLDDGQAPLLSAIGVTTVGLYTGIQQLIQALPPVNVAIDHSFTFTPIPEAGPNSDNYYISFSSTELKVNDSIYKAYSPFFRLTGMSGSFGSPLPSATSMKPIPPSLTRSLSSSSTSTITIGTLSTSSPQPVTTPTTPISSPTPRFSTLLSSSSSSSSSSSLLPLSSSSSIPFPSSTAQSKAVGLTTSSTILLPSSLLISTLFSWFLCMLYS